MKKVKVFKVTDMFSRTFLKEIEELGSSDTNVGVYYRKSENGEDLYDLIVVERCQPFAINQLEEEYNSESIYIGGGYNETDNSDLYGFVWLTDQKEVRRKIK